jgi:hypothetical protein
MDKLLAVVEKLRQKPDHTKRKVAFFAALILTIVIFIVVSVVNNRMPEEERGTGGSFVEESVKPPLENFRFGIERFKEVWKNLQNTPVNVE